MHTGNVSTTILKKAFTFDLSVFVDPVSDFGLWYINPSSGSKLDLLISWILLPF